MMLDSSLKKQLLSIAVAVCLIFGMVPLAHGVEPSQSTEQGQSGASGSGGPGEDNQTSESGFTGSEDSGGEGSQGGSDDTNPDAEGTGDGEDFFDSENEGTVGADGDNALDDEDESDLLGAQSASSEEQKKDAKADTKIEDQPLKAGTYVIRTGLSQSRVLDIDSASKQNNANLQIYISNMTKAQRFKVTIDKQGYYTFTNVRSGKVLDVAGAKKRSGTNVQQYQSNNTKAQKWVVKKNSDGSYTIHSALSSKLVLDVSGASPKNHTNVQIYTDNGSKAQKFYFLPQNPKVEGGKTIKNGIYVLRNSLDTSKVADISGASLSEGGKVQLYQSNNTLAQMFKITYRSDGYYTITALNSAKGISVPDGNLVATETKQYGLGSEISKAKKWAIKQNSDGTYTFISAASGMALAAKGSKAESGTALSTANLSTKNKAQKWMLSPVKTYLKDGIYTLPSRLNQNYVADIASGSTKEDANAQVWSRNNTPAQKFQIKSVGDNEYTLNCLASGKYLSASGVNVVQKKYVKGDSAQIWKVTPSKRGGIVLVNKKTNRALNVAGAKKKDGTNLNLSKTTTDHAQSFLPVKVSVLNNGTYSFQGFAGKRMVDVSGGSTKDGANVQVWKSNNTNAQKWVVRSAGGGYYTITGAQSKKLLDVKNASTKSGANVQQWSKNGSNAQKWKIVYNGDGSYSFISACSSMALNVTGEGASNGKNVNVATPNGSKAQKFRIMPTTADFGDRIASFATYSSNNVNGTYNMMRALRSFDNKVIQPGQTISFFGVAGPCGAAQGYRLAGVVGGSGYGGGICQASTTLYGASVRAGLTIVERSPHSVPSTYVPIGQDAMVSYGSSDLKIRNNHTFPVKIKVTTSGNKLQADFYGILPSWYDTIKVESWRTGPNSAAAQRVYMKNGKRVKVQALRSSYYAG